MKKNSFTINSSINAYFVLYQWVVLVCVLQSFACSFFWGINNIIFTIILFLSSLILISNKGLNITKNNVRWCILYILSFAITQSNNLFGWLVSLLHFFNLYVLFNLKPVYKHCLLFFLRRMFAVLLLLSIVAWILYLMGIPLPHYDTGYGESSTGGFQYYFDNYYFFLVNQVSFLRYVIPRFSSVFLEPGYLGCFMSILLLSDHYRIGKDHWYNIVYLIALILSFSLGGYIFCLFGLVLDKFSKKNGRLFWIFGIVLFIFGSYQFFKNYNDGDNIVNEAIVLRLEIDEAEGTISGYNRSSEEINKYFWNTFIKSSDIFLGDKEILSKYSDSAENEVSWHGYVINYGLIGVLLLVLYFLHPVLRKTINPYGKFCISLLFLAVFSQTVHMVHSLMYIVLFITSIEEIDFEYKQNLYDGNNCILSSTVSSNKKQ